MTSKTRNLVIAITALVIAGGALAFIAVGSLGENLVYYWSPAEMIAQKEKAYGPTIRLGGVVQPGSVKWDADKTELTFKVADSHKPDAIAVAVVAHEVPPQMFREGIGVVVEGTYDKSNTFTAQRVLVNHSNEYRAPQDGNPNHDWKDTLADPAALKAAEAKTTP